MTAITDLHGGLVLEVNRHHRYPGYTSGRHHQHSTCEIVFVHSGAMDLFIRGRTYHAEEGDLCLVDSHEVHTSFYPKEEGADRTSIEVSRAFLADALSDRGDSFDPFAVFASEAKVIRLPTSLRLQVQDMVIAIAGEVENRSPGSISAARSWLTILLILISRNASICQKRQSSFKSAGQSTVAHVTSFISEHYVEDISLSDIAERFSVDRSYLARIFKRYTGLTVVSYINNVRVSEAAKLLSDRRLKTADIAERVGFNSVTHFVRTFSRIIGKSPHGYRSAR